MNVVFRKTLVDFYGEHPDAKSILEVWYQEASKANWSEPQDIKDKYRSADFINSNRVIFAIKKNTYRIVCSINYQRRAVYIKFIDTHAEYSQINMSEVKL